MSLSPTDLKKALAWYDTLQERVTVHTLTSDIVSTLEATRDQRKTPEWYERDLPKGLRLVVTYSAPDHDWREQWEKKLENATTLDDVKVLSHVLIRRAGHSSSMQWIMVQSPTTETLEFVFDCDREREVEYMNKRETAYALAFRDMAHLLLRHLSQKPVDDLAAVFQALRWPTGSQTLAERLFQMGKVTLEDIRHAMNDANFPETEDEE